MSDPEQPGEWVDMEEAQKITGLQRSALMQRKRRGTLTTKIEHVTLSYPGRKVYFRRAELPIKKEEQQQ